MKGTLRVCPGVLRYEFLNVKADSFVGNVGQRRNEVDECGVYPYNKFSTRKALIFK